MDDKLAEIQIDLNYVLERSTDCEDADHFKEYTPKLLKIIQLQREALNELCLGLKEYCADPNCLACKTLKFSWEDL